MLSPVAISLPSGASSDCSSPFVDNLMDVVPSMLIGSTGPPCVKDMPPLAFFSKPQWRSQWQRVL
jgi:hypothetical protein